LPQVEKDTGAIKDPLPEIKLPPIYSHPLPEIKLPTITAFPSPTVRSTTIYYSQDDIDSNPVKENMKNRIPNEQITPPIKRGNAPTSNQDGKPVEIHHEGQNSDGPFQELSRTNHRGGDNYKLNHPNYNKPSEIDRTEFGRQKVDYWKGEWDSGRWINK